MVELIDVEVDIESHAFDLEVPTLLDPFILIDSSDPRFQLIDEPELEEHGRRPDVLRTGLATRVLLNLHPDYWSGEFRHVDDDQVPYLTLKSFGPESDALNLAIKFQLIENILDQL